MGFEPLQEKQKECLFFLVLLALHWAYLINAQNIYFIYIMCRLLLKITAQMFSIKYTVYRQSSCKLGHDSFWDLNSRGISYIYKHLY